MPFHRPCSQALHHAEAGPLPDQLPLVLGEGAELVEHQPALRPGGVDQLGAGLEAHVELVQLGHDVDEVFEAARQPVDLVGQDHVEALQGGLGQQPFQGRPVPGAGGVAVIHVELVHGPALAFRVRAQPLLLGGQGIALLGLLLGGHAGIDGAADKGIPCCLLFGTGEPKINRPVGHVRVYATTL